MILRNTWCTVVLAAAAAHAQIPFATAYRDTTLAHAYSHNYAQAARAANGDVVMVVDLSVTLNDRAIYALRTTAGGSVQWMKRIDVVGPRMWNVTDMALTPNGSIVITGYDDLHGLFLRLDASGTPVAAKWYSWSGNSTTSTLSVLSDTAIVIYGNNRQGSLARGWTAVVDENGNLSTSAGSFQVDGFELEAVNAHPLPDGSAVLYGSSDVIGSPFQNAVAAGAMDSTGNILWASRFSGSGLVLRPVGSMVLPNGSMRLVLRNDGGFTSQSSVVVALDPSGAVAWMKELHPKRGTWDMTALSVAPMSDSSFAIVGYYDPVHSGVLLIDTAANVLGHESWALTIIASEGYRDLNGELVLAAHTPASGSFDPALMRTYAELNLCASATTSCTSNSFTLDVDTGATTAAQSMTVFDVLSDFAPVAIVPVLNEMCVTVGVGENDVGGEGILISPNPATDLLTIARATPGELRLFDTTGRCCLVKTIARIGSVELDIAHLAPGGYHLVLTTARNIQRAAFVIER